MSHPMFGEHRELLEEAVHAIRGRAYWSPWPEHPKAYGEGALDAGREAFDAYREANFYLDQPGVVDRIGAEVSPYGLHLDIRYPRCRPDALIAAARAAMPAWTRAGADVRAGVCVEILARLNIHSPEIAHAAMHTTGQPLAMAFRAAGPQAQARGLEAVALAWREMKEIPDSAVWEKPQGTHASLRLEMRYAVVPRGVALVVGCSTFPTWNAYPGLFASLVTGNPVIVKPHPGAILPLAITVAAARQTLKDAGFDPNLVSLLVDDPDTPITRDVALKPDVRLIDYTGGNAFGDWLQENARQARLFAEKAGVNCVVVDSTDDYPGMLENLAFSLCLYSGQMCTSPQAIFAARSGISTPDGPVTPERFGVDLSQAVGRLLDDDERAVEILGAIQSPASLARIEALRVHDEIIRESSAIRHPVWPDARVATPLLIKLDVADEALYGEERFGPIAFLVETATTSESLAATERIVRDKGAITLLVHTTNPHVRDLAGDLALRAGVSLSFNLCDGVHVNLSAAFSDFHATGANPAANASLTDAAFVAGRFFVVQARQHL